jgi:hypothetical protein
MESMARRVARNLADGCALLLAVSVSGCAPPQYTDVSNPGQTLDFDVPHAWHQISAQSLASELKAAGLQAPGLWEVAYEAGPESTAADFFAFDNAQPFVFAETGTLTSAASAGLSYNALRDFFLPVTVTARKNESSQPGNALSGFRHIRDQVLTPGNGVHGVRETFDYTLTGTGEAATWDEIALTNAQRTRVYFLVLHCSTGCYSADQTQINDVMSSFTVSTVPAVRPMMR